MTIFEERYRVIAVNPESLVVRGVQSREVLVINTDPACPLDEEFFRVGKLIALSDPSFTPTH